MYDAIKKDADKGNHEALVVKLDFEKLFPVNDVCKEYFLILTGEKGYTAEDDSGIDILDLVAKRLQMTTEQCRDVLNKSVKGMVKQNKELWKKWIDNNYRSRLVVPAKKTISGFSNKNDSSFYQADFNRKNSTNKMYKELGLPNDLQELIDVQKKNEDRINELTHKQKTKNEREELKKRIRFNVDLWQDINILKKHYGIEIQSKISKEKVEFVSYTENDLEIIDSDNNDFIVDEWMTNKIKETAADVLTNKQLVIFNLYYVSEMTQQQIADLIGETKGNISRDLKISLEKIRKNL